MARGSSGSGGPAADEEYLGLSAALRLVGVGKTKLGELMDAGVVVGRWVGEGPARRRRFSQASLQELALTHPPRPATPAPDQAACADSGQADPLQSEHLGEIVALRVLVDALMDALVEEAAARHRSLAALRDALRGLDGARRAIVPPDIDAAMRLSQGRAD